jgi:diacylglycerol kinase (ATP)
VKTLVLANPASGRAHRRRELDDLLTALRRNDMFPDLAAPGSKDEAARLVAASAEEGFEIVVAAGGDGTVHTALQGINTEEQTLAVFPLGSGNDLARGLGVPLRPRRAMECLLERNERRADYGVVLNRGLRFLNSIGMGFDTEVLRARQRDTSIIRNNYIALFFKTLVAMRGRKAKVFIDGEPIEGVWFWLIVANSPFIGGGMKTTPDVTPFSGDFQVMLIPEMNRWKVVSIFPRVLRGTHLKSRDIRNYRARRIEVISDEVSDVAADGDLVCETPFAVECVPGGLKVIAPGG